MLLEHSTPAAVCVQPVRRQVVTIIRRHFGSSDGLADLYSCMQVPNQQSYQFLSWP